MKTLATIIIASAILTVTCFAQWDVYGTKRILLLVKLTTIAGHTFTQDEINTLEAASPSLVKMADSDYAIRKFWEMIRDSSPEAIAWTEAQELIRTGRIREIFQSHSLELRMVATNGKRYTTKETRIDEVIDLCMSVDPKKVFIIISQE